jgi:arylsulfatase A-like enzyme
LPAADGRSLVPLLRNEDPASWRKAILLESEGFGEEEVDAPSAFRAVRTEALKYVEYGNGEREFYDLEADPYELDNIYDGSYSSLIQELKTKLDELRSCSGDECRKGEDAR